MKRLQNCATLVVLLLVGCSEDKPGAGSQDGAGAGEEEFEFEVKYGLMNRDPVENDPAYREIFARIDSEVEEILADHPNKGRLGFVHTVWHTKQKRLKEVYGIDWKTPSELNPNVHYD